MARCAGEAGLRWSTAIPVLDAAFRPGREGWNTSPYARPLAFRTRHRRAHAALAARLDPTIVSEMTPQPPWRIQRIDTLDGGVRFMVGCGVMTTSSVARAGRHIGSVDRSIEERSQVW